MTEKIKNILSHWVFILTLVVSAIGTTSAAIWKFNETKLEREREKYVYHKLLKEYKGNGEKLDHVLELTKAQDFNIIKLASRIQYLERLARVQANKISKIISPFEYVKKKK